MVSPKQSKALVVTNNLVHAAIPPTNILLGLVQ